MNAKNPPGLHQTRASPRAGCQAKIILLNRVSPNEGAGNGS